MDYTKLLLDALKPIDRDVQIYIESCNQLYCCGKCGENVHEDDTDHAQCCDPEGE